ncbi:hypothetical protein JCM3765_003514 [Sporobolomyces pararoseus]
MSEHQATPPLTPPRDQPSHSQPQTANPPSFANGSTISLLPLVPASPETLSDPQIFTSSLPDSPLDQQESNLIPQGVETSRSKSLG